MRNYISLVMAQLTSSNPFGMHACRQLLIAIAIWMHALFDRAPMPPTLVLIDIASNLKLKL